MNVLVIGSGGREHALAWKLKQSPQVDEIYCAPGNGGTTDLATNVDISPLDGPALLDFAKTHQIVLTVVGPEAPLVDGIVDEFERSGLKIFGPRRSAARLEGSKVFAKDFMARRNIPTAEYEVFQDYEEAVAFLSKVNFPVVIKADGLAAGKGVFIAQNHEEAVAALTDVMKKKIFKDSGKTVVLEEFLDGEEASVMAISDGMNYVILEPSQDHKRIFDDDMGPNTGGMGAYSPTPVITPDVMKTIEARIIEPTIRGMAQEGTPFHGVLYAGLMITAEGPRVLEYNVRFGDPEAQAVLPRLKSDLAELMLASIDGRLNEVSLAWDDRACVCVVMSSGGYPGEYETGKTIEGLDEVAELPDVVVFHAGTTLENGRVVTSGGRVLGVTAHGDGIADAIEAAYTAVEKIHFEHCFFRRDIGAKALHRRIKPRVTSSNS